MQTNTLSNKDITQKSYQATAQEFARNVADLAPLGSIEKFMGFLPPKARIIDIGCGSGRDAQIFSQMGADVLGIDYSSSMINIAKVNAPLSEFQLMDIESISVPPSSFDGAWAACSLVHIAKSDLPGVLKSIHTLLKDNGYFYIALKEGTGEKLEKDLRYEGDFHKFWSFYEKEELKNILQAAQFEILEFDTVEKNHAYQTHPAFRIFCKKK